MQQIGLEVKDYLLMGVSAVVLWFGRYLRNLIVDLLLRARFLGGFITLLAAYWKDIGVAINKIDTTGFQPSSKQALDKVKDFFAQVDDMLKRIMTVEDHKSKMDSSLVMTMQEMIDEYKRRKELEANNGK